MVQFRRHFLCLHTGSGNLVSNRLMVAFRRVCFLFQFFKSCVFLEILNVGSEVGFLILDFFLFHGSTSGGRGGAWLRIGSSLPGSLNALLHNFFLFADLLAFDGVSTENGGNVHLSEACSLLIGCAGMAIVMP